MARVMQGVVVSNSGNKTVVVKVSTFKVHPIYKKRYSVSKKYSTHDETNKAKIDDIVNIVECKPISKRKKWTLQEITGTVGIKHEDEAPKEAVEEKIAPIVKKKPATKEDKEAKDVKDDASKPKKEKK